MVGLSISVLAEQKKLSSLPGLCLVQRGNPMFNRRNLVGTHYALYFQNVSGEADDICSTSNEIE
jgi:hypothetical protein